MSERKHNADDPRVVAGMAAQGRARAQLVAGGARATGWKAGLGAAAAMERVGTAAPIAGFLTDATAVGDGGHITIGGWDAPTFEPELAVLVGDDLEITAIAPAIELVDLGPPDDLEAVLAGNIFHRAYAVGPWVETSTLALDGARLCVTVAGEVRAKDVDPSVILGDLAEVVAAVATQAALASGPGLRAGDLVITGSAIPAIALSSPATLTVAIEGPDSTVTVEV